MQRKPDKNKLTKAEIIACVILGLMVAAIFALIITVLATSGSASVGTTPLPPCCQ